MFLLRYSIIRLTAPFVAQALRQNDQPHKDFGVEVLYRFSNIDLLSSCTISSYFG